MAAATPLMCLLERGIIGGGIFTCSRTFVRFYPSPSKRILAVSCKMRHRNFSFQNKKQNAKKFNIEHPRNANFQPDGDNASDTKNSSKDSTMSPNQDSASKGDMIITVESEPSNEKNHIKYFPSSEVKIVEDDTVVSAGEAANLYEEPVLSSSPSNNIIPVPVFTNEDEEQLSGIHLQDLVGMIKNAEKNVHLLNHARIRALKDLENIIDEKEALQGEINFLEMKLSETDARLKMASQEKIRMELLEDQLEKLRNELFSRGGSMEHVQNMSAPVSSQVDALNYFTQELDLLKAENMSLKDELDLLKADLISVRETDQRVQNLEEERLFLVSSLKEFEFKLAASQENVSEISSLKSECQSLNDKVNSLQVLLDKATKHPNQDFQLLQQNQVLSKKVSQLEESLNETNVYRMSFEKMQHSNELMQQKMKLLDERLQRSDEELHSYVQLYQDSVKEFQDILNNFKEENNKRGQDESVHDKPSEFWSKLLLMVDGWLLEKKILADEARLLREMIWNREGRICDAYTSSNEKNEREIIAAFLRLISSTPSERLNIIHIAAELAPVAKVGGLGDVLTGLSKSLQNKGHIVEIVIPKYDCMNYELIRDFKAFDVPVESYFDGQLFKNKIWVGTVEGLPVYFIEPLHPSEFFSRSQFYGEHDDFKRFSFFSRAALELLLQADKKPDIIHCHDWQTAFVAPLYWDLYFPKGLDSARICFTCHNFEYQGIAPASDLASCGLDVYHLNRHDRMQDNSSSERVNPVKGAIVFSNIVTTVSPSYAQEVRTPEGGRGLDTTLNLHSKKFVGILNGIDTDAWNPATDRFLKVQYHAYDIEGKQENKKALISYLRMSFASSNRPLVACITRLVPQKGVHLIRHALYRTLELGGQFVLLGSSPVPQIQREFEDIGNHFKNHEHAQLILKYDESLAHLIYAASDMFIIPSIFEPCGLTQMIAMRYGSIPIARKTGGLNDSVFDIDDDTIPVQYRNGFTFLTPDEQGLNNALERAFYHYKNDGDGWKQLVQKVMSIDFSWDSSALLYEELYTKSVARAKVASRT